jgi:hypothetical protein
VDELEPRDRALPAVPEDRETLLAILSGVQRKGAWEPAEHVRVYAVMGGAELDFSEAVMLEGVTELRIFALWGGVEVRVPDDIHVESRGVGVLGGFAQLDHRCAEPDASTLRISGFAVMGGVDVKRKKDRRFWRRG